MTVHGLKNKGLRTFWSRFLKHGTWPHPEEAFVFDTADILAKSRIPIDLKRDLSFLRKASGE